MSTSTEVRQRRCATPGCVNRIWLLPEQESWTHCASCQEKRRRLHARMLVAGLLAAAAAVTAWMLVSLL